MLLGCTNTSKSTVAALIIQRTIRICQSLLNYPVLLKCVINSIWLSIGVLITQYNSIPITAALGTHLIDNERNMLSQ